MKNKKRFTTAPDDLTKAAGIIPIAADTGRILLNRRGPKLNDPFKLSCWGGYCALGETCEENAIREFGEESGYSGSIQLVKILIDQNPTKKVTFTTFVGVIPNEFDPILDDESDGYIWISSGQLKSGELSSQLQKDFSKAVAECEMPITSIAQACLMGRWYDTLWAKVSVDAQV